jgi:hypothetical protein
MNAPVFIRWFKDLLGRLPPGTLIICDNASYHSSLSDGFPKSADRVDTMREWCTRNNVDHNTYTTKSALWAYLRLLRESEPEKYGKYEVDMIARAAGHEIARLPPYNSHLNPIELVWALFKPRVRKENTKNLLNKKANLSRMETLAAETFDTITNEEIADIWRHTADIWRKYASGPVVHLTNEHEETGEVTTEES